MADFVGGWFVGDFDPAVIRTSGAEVSVKSFMTGETDAEHYQRQSQEVTVVVAGRCRIGGKIMEEGDIVLIHPLEAADFEAITDVTLVAVKVPSLPSDKVVGRP